jgi:hypothetical protein
MSRITRGCHRVSIDFPLGLYDAIKEHSDAPPKVAFGEWVRRICAHRVGYEFPPASGRGTKDPCWGYQAHDLGKARP